MRARAWFRLAGTVLVCQLAGVAGAILTAPAIPVWYESLRKPAFTPPNAVFGPVWTILYAMMAVSLHWVLENRDRRFMGSLGPRLFWAQLAMTVAWSFLFFGLRSPMLGLLAILALWPMIAVMILLFYAVSKPAAWMLVPYFLWVSFATLLNFSIVVLNAPA